MERAPPLENNHSPLLLVARGACFYVLATTTAARLAASPIDEQRRGATTNSGDGVDGANAKKMFVDGSMLQNERAIRRRLSPLHVDFCGRARRPVLLVRVMGSSPLVAVRRSPIHRRRRRSSKSRPTDAASRRVQSLVAILTQRPRLFTCRSVHFITRARVDARCRASRRSFARRLVEGCRRASATALKHTFVCSTRVVGGRRFDSRLVDSRF